MAEPNQPTSSILDPKYKEEHDVKQKAVDEVIKNIEDTPERIAQEFHLFDESESILLAENERLKVENERLRAENEKIAAERDLQHAKKEARIQEHIKDHAILMEKLQKALSLIKEIPELLKARKQQPANPPITS